MKLTPELKDIATKAARIEFSADDDIKAVLHCIERFLAALPNSEPVAQVKVSAAAGNAGITWIATAVNDFDSLPILKDGTKLYAAPPIQQDYKEQLAESQAREAKLRDVIDIYWQKGITAEFYNAVRGICWSPKPNDATALNELIAKAGEVMREWALEAFVYRSDTTRMTIRAIPGVTLEDL